MKKFWEGWKRFGQFIGDALARVVLTLFYFTIFLPFGLAVSLFMDPLMIKKHPGSNWLARTTHDKTLEDARRQG